MLPLDWSNNALKDLGIGFGVEQIVDFVIDGIEDK
jgi:hypothetical protein